MLPQAHIVAVTAQFAGFTQDGRMSEWMGGEDRRRRLIGRKLMNERDASNYIAECEPGEEFGDNHIASR